MCQVSSEGGQVCSPPHLGLGDQKESAFPAHSANWAGASVPQERRGSRRPCPDGCWHGSSQEPGFGEQAGVTAGPPPCGEEPPDKSPCAGESPWGRAEAQQGRGSRLRDPGDLSSPRAPTVPSRAQHGGSPLPEPPTVGRGCGRVSHAGVLNPSLSQPGSWGSGLWGSVPHGHG